MSKDAEKQEKKAAAMVALAAAHAEVLTLEAMVQEKKAERQVIAKDLRTTFGVQGVRLREGDERKEYGLGVSNMSDIAKARQNGGTAPEKVYDILEPRQRRFEDASSED